MMNEQGESGTSLSHCEEEGKKYSVVTEGKATILQPASVFYNPVQEFNRDITIAVISEFAEDHAEEVKEKQRKKREGDRKKNGETLENSIDEPDLPLQPGVPHPSGLRILEGLAASGLRSMRFAKEIPGVKKIICNDFDTDAVDVIKKNIVKNDVGDLVEPSQGDASMVMYRNKAFKDRFDVVDLDPYGTVAPFLDAAVQSVRDGGVLCVTSTDSAVLCGSTPEKCYALYGSVSLRTKFCHEQALRILLHCIESHAARHSRYIKPLISLSVDFYFRLFVKVYSGQYKTKFVSSRTGMGYYCTGCGVYTLQPLCDAQPTKNDQFKFVPSKGPPVTERCEHCNWKHQLFGPLYLGPLHDQKFVERVIGRVTSESQSFGTGKRIEGMLSVVLEELDLPLYLEADELYSVLHCHPAKIMDIRSAILNAGYRVSFSHAKKNSLKTDAPNHVIWDILRAFVEKTPIETKRNVEGTPGYNILLKKPSMKVDFTLHPEANPSSRSQGLVRFQPNPERNWGPKPRARRAGDGENMEDRRLKNQGKRSRKDADEKASGDDKKENESVTATE